MFATSVKIFRYVRRLSQQDLKQQFEDGLKKVFPLCDHEDANTLDTDTDSSASKPGFNADTASANSLGETQPIEAHSFAASTPPDPDRTDSDFGFNDIQGDVATYDG